MMFPDEPFFSPAAAPPVDDNSDSPNPEPKKRNSGRTGPTSPEGKAKSAQNARKHGACANTLILPSESEFGWEILKSRWEDIYKPDPESLEADFVLRAAQAEWFRLRVQRQYDDFMISIGGRHPFSLTPDEIKMQDLMLRYKGNAERTFQREFRTLEAYYKSHKPAPSSKSKYSNPGPPPIIRLASIEEIREDIRRQRSSIMDDPLYTQFDDDPFSDLPESESESESQSEPGT
jgi:hypothetical protein